MVAPPIQNACRPNDNDNDNANANVNVATLELGRSVQMVVQVITTLRIKL